MVTLDDLNVLNQNAAYARQKGEEASVAAQLADTARQNLEELGGDTQAAGQQATQAAQAATLAKNSATAAALQASQAAGDAVTAAELAEGAAGTANQAAGAATTAAQRVTDAVLDLTDIKVATVQATDEARTEVDRLRLVNNVGDADINLLLRQWTQAEAYEPTTITRNSDGLVTTATVTWPDGSTGTLTATNYNATHSVYDGFTVTHASGKTVTQAAVTRDSSGAVTAKPALVVS
ncbi:hypothetical protein CBQ26_13630 [Deinococcus indicus]|uniref:Uncharacterized protein n=1 Tax=Deinococcus indicus TaxID=223556 RepID=A0A246BIN2_9DEIO|nr:hypothetical protein CBQ26_13630 [Deinococcus indicus]